MSAPTASFDFTTEYEGVPFHVFYNVDEGSDENGPWTSIDMVAATVGGHDVMLVITDDVFGDLRTRAKADYKAECRLSRAHFGLQQYQDAREVAHG